MSPAPLDSDLTLLALAERAMRPMSDGERLFVLGCFAGAVRALAARVRELYAEADDMHYADALPPLHAVMTELGAPEDWAQGGR